jgi:hypothetical protein
MVVNDRLLLPILQPSVTQDMGIVLVGLAVAVFPVVELASLGRASRGVAAQAVRRVSSSDSHTR